MRYQSFESVFQAAFAGPVDVAATALFCSAFSDTAHELAGAVRASVKAIGITFRMSASATAPFPFWDNSQQYS